MADLFDVVVVGAGPVGLFLACDLKAAGVSVVVLEKDESPASPWKVGVHGKRGLYIHPVEAFYRRGLHNEILHLPPPISEVEKHPDFHLKVAGHFAGARLSVQKANVGKWKHSLPLSVDLWYPATSNLESIEGALLKRASELGVVIRRGMEVDRVAEQDGEVRVWAKGHTEYVRGKYLVGCDGEKSVIREKAEFGFEGSPAEFRGYVVDCELANPDILPIGLFRTPNGMYIRPADGKFILADFHTLDFDPSTEAITREHFESVLRRVSGKPAEVTALHRAMSMTTELKQATEYRKGNIFLAGDSAHVHPSFGAQGISAGIGDAVNLAWKLAAVINGVAENSLLDTYGQERHPVGAQILQWAHVQLSLLRPNPYSRATGSLLHGLIKTKDGVTHFLENILGLERQYDLDKEGHDLVGYSAPDFQFADGSRLGSMLHQPRFLVVDFTENQDIATYAAGLTAVVRHTSSMAKETVGLKALVVRPDGVITWATEDASEVTLANIKTALGRWLDIPNLETAANLVKTQQSMQQIKLDEKSSAEPVVTAKEIQV